MDECDSAAAAPPFTIAAAPSGLQDVVDRVWMARAEHGDDGGSDHIVPDGCVEIVFNLGDPFERETAVGAERQPLVLLVGQMTTPVSVRPTGRVDLVGLRLKAECASAWVGAPAWALRDRLIPADDALGDQVHRLRDALGESLAAGARLDAIARHCAGWARRAAPVDPAVAWTLDEVRRIGGVGAIGRLAALAGIERRRLERGFRRWVGLTPKEFARITRVQRALALLERRPRPTGAEIAVRCGYADQSHLIREFRALVGPAPGGAGTDGLAAWLRSAPSAAAPG